MTPPKQGVSTKVGKNFTEALHFDDLAVEKKNLKKHFTEYSFSAFEGAPFKPLKHTMTFFRKMF